MVLLGRGRETDPLLLVDPWMVPEEGRLEGRLLGRPEKVLEGRLVVLGRVWLLGRGREVEGRF